MVPVDFSQLIAEGFSFPPFRWSFIIDAINGVAL